MTVLNRNQIAGYASKAGFTGDDLNIAVAVALAESGGNTNSHNSTPPDDSYGLWQINMLGDMGPSRRAQYGLKSNADLYDPAINARVAYGIRKGSGWDAWTTYKGGKYKQFMDGNNTPSDVSASVDTSMPTTVDSGSAILGLGTGIFRGIENIGAILIAIVLLGIGALILLRDQLPTGKLIKAAKGAVS